jgi:hypothetical protein
MYLYRYTKENYTSRFVPVFLMRQASAFSKGRSAPLHLLKAIAEYSTSVPCILGTPCLACSTAICLCNILCIRCHFLPVSGVSQVVSGAYRYFVLFTRENRLWASLLTFVQQSMVFDHLTPCHLFASSKRGISGEQGAIFKDKRFLSPCSPCVPCWMACYPLPLSGVPWATVSGASLPQTLYARPHTSHCSPPVLPCVMACYLLSVLGVVSVVSKAIFHLGVSRILFALLTFSLVQ